MEFKPAVLFVIWLLLLQCSHPAKPTLHPNTGKQADSLFKSAQKLIDKGDYTKAYDLLNQSLKTLPEKSKNLLLAKIYTQMARLDSNNHNYPGAEYNISRALAVLPENHPKYLAYIYSLTASIYKAQKKYSGFLQYQKKFYDIMQQQQDTLPVFIKYHNNLGNYYNEIKDHDQAITHYDLILKNKNIAEQYSLKYARALDNKAIAYLAGKNWQKAFSLLWQAKNIFIKHKSIRGLTYNYYFLSNYFLKKNDSAMSRQYALQALRLSRQYKYKDKIPDLYKRLAETDPQNAAHYFASYVRLQDSLMAKERAFKEQSALIRFETQEKEKEIAEQKLKIKNQKYKMLFLAILTLGILLGAVVFYKQKNKIARQYDTIKLLQDEVNHRLVNGLKLISSLVNQIKREFDVPALQERLDYLNTRIEIIYEIHKQLYKDEKNIAVSLKKYYDTVAQSFLKLYPNHQVEVINNIDPKILLPFKKTLRLGLILAEFVNNSLKYAFPDGQGKIYLEVEKLPGNRLKIIIKDNGKGLKLDGDKAKGGFGVKMMEGLTKQLEGTFKKEIDNGFKIVITIPYNPLNI